MKIADMAARIEFRGGCMRLCGDVEAFVHNVENPAMKDFIPIVCAQLWYCGVLSRGHERKNYPDEVVAAKFLYVDFLVVWAPGHRPTLHPKIP